jgi:hypothetical protein
MRKIMIKIMMYVNYQKKFKTSTGGQMEKEERKRLQRDLSFSHTLSIRVRLGKCSL